MEKTVPEKLKKGDTIGVVAPSKPIIDENVQEIEEARKIVEKDGYKVKYSKNLFKNTTGYCATAKERADDINSMFADKTVKMIWCAKGGEGANSVFEYLDFDLIQKNPKIICGYSDITSITNIISEKANMVTYSSTNFKSIATDESDFSYKKAIEMFSGKSTKLGTAKGDKYKTIQKGVAEGELIGGNLSITKGMVAGKYSINFKNKILFIEDLGYESAPEIVSGNLYFMKQNGIFDEINGLWIGNYEHESGITLEQIVKDVIGDEYKFPIIKSNNFGHGGTNIAIPIGAMAIIDTSLKNKINLI